MSEAKKCDRCGTFYSASRNCGRIPKYMIGLNGDGRYSSFQEIDLCDACMDKLDKFITWGAPSSDDGTEATDSEKGV